MAKKTKVLSPKSTSQLWFWFPDIHFPDQDVEALEVALAAHRILKPTYSGFLGDVVDCDIFSSHSKKTIQEAQTQDFRKLELDPCNALIDEVQANTKKMTYFLEGNHEQRIERWAVNNGRVGESIYDLISPTATIARGRKNFEMIPYEVPSGLRRGFVQIAPSTAKMKTGGLVAVHGWSFAKHAAYVHLEKSRSQSVLFGHCFSSDTELLTANGWKTHDQIFEGDLVATMNKNTRNIEYQNVNEKFVYSNYDKLVHFKSTALDHLVTEDHGMVYEDQTGKLQFPKAKDWTQKGTKVVVSGNWTGVGNTNWSDNEIRLLVQCVTDGAREKGHYWRWHLQKDRKIERLTSLLKDMKINFTVNPQKYHTTKIYVGRLPEKFTKELDSDLLRTFSPRQNNILLEEWSYTDGSRYENSWQLTTSIKEHADLLQEIAVISGNKCNVSLNLKQWALSIRPGVTTVCCDNNHNKGRVPYKGEVFCVSVDNGTLLARRKGKVVVTQNTHRAQSITSRDPWTGNLIKSFNPGTLSHLQPTYAHGGSPSDWSHGFCLIYVGAESWTEYCISIVKGRCVLPDGREIRLV